MSGASNLHLGQGTAGIYVLEIYAIPRMYKVLSECTVSQGMHAPRLWTLLEMGENCLNIS